MKHFDVVLAAINTDLLGRWANGQPVVMFHTVDSSYSMAIAIPNAMH